VSEPKPPAFPVPNVPIAESRGRSARRAAARALSAARTSTEAARTDGSASTPPTKRASGGSSRRSSSGSAPAPGEGRSPNPDRLRRAELVVGGGDPEPELVAGRHRPHSGRVGERVRLRGAADRREVDERDGEPDRRLPLIARRDHRVVLDGALREGDPHLLRVAEVARRRIDRRQEPRSRGERAGASEGARRIGLAGVEPVLLGGGQERLERLERGRARGGQEDDQQCTGLGK
jgi:hypothetical protein